MVTMVMFHHVQGLTPGVQALADRFRGGGHDVVLPDLFDGRTFDSIQEGFAFHSSAGSDVDARADEIVAALPQDIVYAGISFGVMPAQRLAQTRAGARGALLIEACAPISGEYAFGAWPSGLQAQIHGMDGDEFFVGDGDVKAAEEIVSVAPGSQLFLYPGRGHLFCDSSLQTYDAAATDAMVTRALAFFATL